MRDMLAYFQIASAQGLGSIGPRMKKARKRINKWTTLAFVAFGCTAPYLASALYFQKSQGRALPAHWILLGASLFVAFMTTGGLQDGRFFGDFYEATRAKTSVSFWANVVIGYAFAAALRGLFVWGLFVG